MNIKHSQKISSFLRPYEEEDWYGEFMETGDFCDLWYETNLYSDDAVEEGVKLARKAKDRQIWSHSDDWGTFYFIGPEQEVLNRIEIRLKTWLKTNQKTPEDLEKEFIRKAISNAETLVLAGEKAKVELTRLKKQAKTKIKTK